MAVFQQQQKISIDLLILHGRYSEVRLTCACEAARASEGWDCCEEVQSVPIIDRIFPFKHISQVIPNGVLPFCTVPALGFFR